MEKYGVDLDKPLTPLIVRDVLVNCFFETHCADVGLTSEDKETNRIYCGELVKKVFIDSGGDFDQPTKEALIKVLDQLADFSKSFRNPELIQKHYQEIKDLVEKLP